MDADGQIWIIYEIYSSFGIVWIMLDSNLHPFLTVLLSHKNSEHNENTGKLLATRLSPGKII